MALVSREDWYGWKPTDQGWTWYGREVELIKAIAPRLREQGFKLNFEVRLVARVGRVDIVAWKDGEEAIFVEAKCLPNRMGNVPYYRETMQGLGQILLYRELIERQPEHWHIGVGHEIVAYGGSLWQGALPPVTRWVLLIASPDDSRFEVVVAAAKRAGIEVWHWLPPGELKAT